jgi:hypothetical protein
MDSFSAVRPIGQPASKAGAISRVGRMLFSAGLLVVLVCAVFTVRGSNKSAAVSLEERAGSEQAEPSSTDEVNKHHALQTHHCHMFSWQQLDTFRGPCKCCVHEPGYRSWWSKAVLHVQFAYFIVGVYVSYSHHSHK